MKLKFLILSIILFVSCSKKDDVPQTNQNITPVQDFSMPKTEDIVMYEVNLGAFSSSGDLLGVTKGIGRIKSLGANVIWLMPIYPIGQVNSVGSPYCVRDYKEVNSDLGTMAGLKNLVNQAHSQGMAVILDWVANHTAWDNPWIENKDWYTQDVNGNIISPPGTNWTDVADLNYNNQQMRLAMIDAMEFWIKNADIDGFRCDAADMVPFDFWKQAIDSLNNFTKKDLVMLAEGARADHFTAGFDLNFSWDFYGKLIDVFDGNAQPSALFSVNQSEYASVPVGKEKLRFTTNHDESAWNGTPIQLFNGKEGALAASVITIFMGGVPLFYDGQEVGVADNISFFNSDPINWSLNQDMLNDYKTMMNFYNGSTTARIGKLTKYNDASVVAFTLDSNKELVFVAVNIKNSVITYNVPAALSGKNWTDALSGDAFDLQEQTELQSYQYLILKSEYNF